MRTISRRPDHPVPAGNLYDKHGTRNPVARRLVAAHTRSLDGLIDAAGPAEVLDVGCGEGFLTERWAQRLRARVAGLDLDDAGLRAEWKARRAPGLSFQAYDGGRLPFDTGEFDLVAGIEVLEHAARPAWLLAEMRRCARRHVLLSVPREPLWRGLNLARGAHWRTLGDTPGHRHHWSRNAFLRLAGTAGIVTAHRVPLPWTVVLVAAGDEHALR